MKLLRPWELLKLYWSESGLNYCCYEFHLSYSYQAYFDLCDKVSLILVILVTPRLEEHMEA